MRWFMYFQKPSEVNSSMKKCCLFICISKFFIHFSVLHAPLSIHFRLFSDSTLHFFLRFHFVYFASSSFWILTLFALLHGREMMHSEKHLFLQEKYFLMLGSVENAMPPVVLRHHEEQIWIVAVRLHTVQMIDECVLLNWWIWANEIRPPNKSIIFPPNTCLLVCFVNVSVKVCK